MSILEFLTKFGSQLSGLTILIVLLALYFGTPKFGLFVKWQCGLCGKLNETNLISFMLNLCDHGGHFN